MRRFLILLTFTTFCSGVQGQRPDPGDYIYPVRDVRGLYAANFGEIRAGHFHTGVDIKTEGVEGKQVVAVADGYVSRVIVSAGGYGRAVFLVLHNGTTAVYGHMQRFNDDLETYVRNERYGRKTNSVDLKFDPQAWPVKQGETVGWSGNSGASGGPHLHYELRTTATGNYLNPVREGIIRPKDDIPPRITCIRYVEADSVNGICLRSEPQSYATQQIAPGRYRLVQREPLTVGPRGYFIAEVTDRRNGSSNTFGIWRLTASADGSPFYEFRMDGFSPEHARCSNAVSCYPLQRTSRNEVIRLAQLTGCPGYFYTRMEERGIIRTGEGQTRRIRLETEDDTGNISRLEFDIRGGVGAFRATPDTLATAFYPDRAATVRLGRGFTAEIPAGTLYEAMYCRPEQIDTPQPDSGLVVLSPAYRLFDASTPLHRSITASIRADIPPRFQLRATLARVTPRGLAFVGGTYADGVVRTSTRTAGDLAVVADTLPPRVQPLFTEGTDLTRESALRFRAVDNFSGVNTWTLRIDGEWVPCDRFPMKGTLVHVFDKPAEKRLHTVELAVTDACGNTSRCIGTFYR